MRKLLTLLFLLIAATVFCQNRFTYPVWMKADSNRLFVGAHAGYVITCMDDSGNFEWSPAGGGGVVQPAGQIIYGTGVSVTSDGNHTIDTASGAVFFSSINGQSHTFSCVDVSVPINNTVSIGSSSSIDINSSGVSDFSDLKIDTSGVNVSGSLSSSGYGYKLATTTGTNGQVLTTDGGGQTSWAQFGASNYGVYKPDTSAGSDITDFVIDSASYIRVGNVVSVTGYISNLSSAPVGNPSIQIGLPIATNITRVGQLTGQIIINATAITGTYILGNTSTEKAVLNLAAGLSNNICTFSFSYIVR